MLGFYVLNIAGVCLRCLFPLTNHPACDAGRAGKVEPLSTFTVAVAQLRYRQGMLTYLLKSPVMTPAVITGGLWLYGNQP